MNRFSSGVSYLLAGFDLISKPGLKRYVIIPVCINILLFSCVFFVFYYFMSEFNHWFEGLLPSWLLWLGFVLWIFFFLGFFLVFIYSFVTLANVVAAPFNSLLAEKVEAYLWEGAPSGRQISHQHSWVAPLFTTMGRQFAILGYYLPRACLILILFFIPIIQTMAPLIWFLFSAWYMTMAYLDYPTDNHHIPFKEVRVWLTQRRRVSLGFGISVLIASMIPVLNLLVMPAAVAGAVKFWLKEQNSVSE